MQAISQILYLAFGALLLLGSGLGILWLVPSLRRNLTGIESVIVALLVSSGLTGVWSLIGRAIGLRITAWAVALAVASALLLGAGWLARRRGQAARPDLKRTEASPDRERLETSPDRARLETPTDRSRPDIPSSGDASHREPGYYRTVLLSLAAIAFLLMLREGGSLGPVHDSLDFVSFVNETLQSGDLAPSSPIYKAAPGIPPDPRRGSFHTEVAAICALSGTRATDAWKWLPRLLAPIAILGLAAMLRAWIGTREATLAAILFVATTFLTTDRFIQNIGYASRFGWICGWGALLSLARGIDLRAATERGARRAFLLIAAASPAFLLAVHLLTGFQVLLSLGCAGLAILCSRAATRADRRAVLWMMAGAVVLLLPAFALRLVGNSGGKIAANPLFDHLYGVLLVRPGWPVLLPSYFLERAGVSGIAASLLAFALIPAIARNRAAGFLAWSTLIPLAILFFPPISRAVIDAHAHSLLSRVILAIPFSGVLAWTILRSIDWVRTGGAAARGSADRNGIGSRRGIRLRRAAGIAALALVACAVAIQAVSTRSSWAALSKHSAEYQESKPLLAALDFLDARFPQVETILTDPITSYAIPAYTRHDAVSPFAQHSSPSDPTVSQRIRDVQEVLNGRVGLARTFEVIRRYHVDLILVNQSFPRFQQAYYVYISGYAFDEQSAKFEGAPAYFEKIYDEQNVRIYRVHDPGPGATLPGDPENPSRIADPLTPAILQWGPIQILSASSREGVHSAGQPCPVDFVWRCAGPPANLPIACDMKLQLHDPPDGGRSKFLNRLADTFVPSADREVGRFGSSFRPLQTYYPDFLWKPGETYKEAAWVSVPPRALPGLYDLYIRLRTEPAAPVLSLEGILTTRLGPDWHRIDAVTIGSADQPVQDRQAR